MFRKLRIFEHMQTLNTRLSFQHPRNPLQKNPPASQPKFLHPPLQPRSPRRHLAPGLPHPHRWRPQVTAVISGNGRRKGRGGGVLGAVLLSYKSYNLHPIREIKYKTRVRSAHIDYLSLHVIHMIHVIRMPLIPIKLFMYKVITCAKVASGPRRRSRRSLSKSTSQLQKNKERELRDCLNKKMSPPPPPPSCCSRRAPFAATRKH